MLRQLGGQLGGQLGEYEPLMIVYSSLIVAGAFLHNTQFGIYFYFGWLLFLIGLPGILSLFFGSLSDLSLRRLTETRTDIVLFLLCRLIYFPSKYLRYAFEVVTILTFIVFLSSGAVILYQIIINPTSMLPAFNTSTNTTEFLEKNLQEFKILSFLINLISVYLISLLLYAGLLGAIPVTLRDIAYDYNSILYEPNWIKKYKNFERKTDNFFKTKKGRICMVFILILFLMLYLHLFTSIRLF